MKKILILGSGFAGVQAAIDLQKSKTFDVTLVSDRDFMYLFPISIWIPIHGIAPQKTRIPLHDISKKHGFNVAIDSVKQIKSEDNKVICGTQTFEYDYLVVALGADKIQMKGMEYTDSICGKPAQTMQLRDKIDALIAKGSGKIAIGFGGNPKDKSAVRGGPAFELMFNLDLYLRKKNIRDKFELTMFAPMPKPGIKMGKKAYNSMLKMFKAKNIATRFGKKITEFTAQSVIFEDHTELLSDVTMFISGGKGSSVMKNSDLPLNESGFIKTDKFCQVENKENVYAIGDSAALLGPDWVAKQGHVAEVMATNAAYNIKQQETNSGKKKSYENHISIICVMDTGNGAVIIFRNSKKEIMIPLPIVGHWIKQGWGKYARWTKLKMFPKIF